MTKKQKKLRLAFTLAARSNERERLRISEGLDIARLHKAILPKHRVKVDGKSLSRARRDQKFDGVLWQGKPLDSMRHPKGKRFVTEYVRTWHKTVEPEFKEMGNDSKNQIAGGLEYLKPKSK